MAVDGQPEGTKMQTKRGPKSIGKKRKRTVELELELVAVSAQYLSYM